jgi:hypothetical protein
MNQQDREKLQTLRVALHAVQQQLALHRHVGHALGVSTNEMSQRPTGRLSLHCNMSADMRQERRTLRPVLLSLNDAELAAGPAAPEGIYPSGAAAGGGISWLPPSESKSKGFGEFDAPGNLAGRHFGGFEDTNGNKLR